MNSKDFQFMIECQTSELIKMLMNDYGFNRMKAMDTLYNSETYKKLESPQTELFFQSPLYVYQYLKSEMTS